LCNGIVKFTIKRDPKGKFKFASLQSDSGQALLKRLGLPTDDFDSFVFINGDKYFLKSSAGLHVLKELGGLWSLFYVFIVFPRPLRDFIYQIIAKTRYRIFGKRDACMIPTQDIKARFLHWRAWEAPGNCLSESRFRATICPSDFP
jgi:predicted DCC family thiol-disulfide oxidoreductase YuxK